MRARALCKEKKVGFSLFPTFFVEIVNFCLQTIVYIDFLGIFGVFSLFRQLATPKVRLYGI